MDKKLRKAAEKITMPDDMKERIIKACENIDKTNIERTDNDGYTEVVSGTERISRKNSIIRIVSAAAACAVLAAGIGTTGVLLHKNHSRQLADSDIVDVTEQLYNPFVDFTKVNFDFYSFDENYDGYSDETYAKLADFFNKFNWGEEYENAEGREFEQDSPTRYGEIHWEDDKGSNSVTIEKDGFVSYKRYVLSGKTENLSMDIAFTKYYMIDFEAFDKGIKEILAQDGIEPENNNDDIRHETSNENNPFGQLLDSGYSISCYSKELTEEQCTALMDMFNAEEWTESVDYDHIAHINSDPEKSSLLKFVSFYGENGSRLDLCEDDIAEYVYNNGDGTYTRYFFSYNSKGVVSTMAYILSGEEDYGYMGDEFYFVTPESINGSYSRYICANLYIDSLDWIPTDDRSMIPADEEKVTLIAENANGDKIYFNDLENPVRVNETGVYYLESGNEALTILREMFKPYQESWTLNLSVTDQNDKEIELGVSSEEATEFLTTDFADMLTETSELESGSNRSYYITISYVQDDNTEAGYSQYYINDSGYVMAYDYYLSFDGELYPEGYGTYMIDFEAFAAKLGI